MLSPSRLLFGIYKYFFSPALHLLVGPSGGCRFEPTCGRYGEEAVERHGWVRGGAMAVSRILRCHPFSRTGSKGLIDPVPQRAITRATREN